MPKIEICLEDIASVIAAEQGGADRVELCSDLFEGGLTPTLGTFRTCKAHSQIPLNVMIRPRGGDFCYSDLEFEAMLEEVRIFKSEGANAVVFGILREDGEIDTERSARLIEVARPLPVTFHRAFDMTPEAHRSLKTLIELGVDRVLTSGLEPTVPEGADMLSELVKEAGERIVVMPGCGISERNFKHIDSIIHAKEYHVFLPGSERSRMTYHPGHIYMGGMLRQDEFTITHTDEGRVSDIMQMAGRK